jgi:hypothetical protein
MTAQPNTQPEQTTDPAVRARLMAACDTTDVLPVASLRQRLARAARPAWRPCRARR